MKKRILSFCLTVALLLCLAPTAAAEENVIAYPVVGGNIYFDKLSGTVTDCDSSVTETVIPSEIDGVAVRSVARFAFESCEKLEKVVISEGVESIGYSAFAYCAKLKSVELPDSLRVLENICFFDCVELSQIKLGTGIEWIGKDAFWGTAFVRNEKNWKNGLLCLGTCLLGAKTTLSGSCTVPSNIKVIAAGAFYTCTSLTSVSLPDGLISICDEGFYYCTQLEEISIPDSVKVIGASAFRHCAKLETVTVGSGMEEIREQAFAFCGELKTAVLGRGLRLVGSKAFEECDKLEEIYFLGDAPALGEHPFDIYSYGEKTYAPIPGLTLCYTQTAKGWQSPAWNGYPTACRIPTANFSDVSAESWYKNAVDYAVANGLMNGTGKGKFEPESPMTRAMLVTVLWRFEGQPAAGENKFSDVKNDQWYASAVAWAAAEGIVGGVGNGRFDPEGKITREQLATILFRYCNAKSIDTSARGDLKEFPDGKQVSDYAQEALSWAVSVGLVTGSKVGNSTYLQPQGNATRAQVATILMRFIENITK